MKEIFTMYLIFLLIVLNKFAQAEDDSNESKYIDLLPEKEKEEFLQRIARRILADVKTKDDRDKYDGEISEDELNTHDDFVQKILKEESYNLRRNDLKEKDKDEDKNENLKVKSLESIQPSLNRDDDDDDKYIDLTLRHGRRDKRNKNSQEISVEVQVDDLPVTQHSEVNNTESTNTIKENQAELVNVKETSTKESNETKSVEESDSEDIRIKPARRNSDKDTEINTYSIQNITTEPSELNVTHLDNFDVATPETNHEANNITENESSLDTSTSSSLGEEMSEAAEETTVTNAFTNDSTTQSNVPKFINNNQTELETIESDIFENITENEYSPRRDIKIDVTESVTERLNDGITSINSVVEEVTNKNTVADIKQDNTTDEMEGTTIVNIEIPNLTTVQNTESTIVVTQEGDETKMKVTESRVNNISSIETKSLPRNFTLSYNVNKDESEKPDKPVATTVKYDTHLNDTIPILRVSDLNKQNVLNANENVSAKSIDGIEKESNKNSLKEYNVFEVSPGEPPLVQKGPQINQEQPYYVPVYNYEPNNAYFNAHNRLGPNYESDKPPYKDYLKEKPKKAGKDGVKFESDYFFDSKEQAHRKFRFGVSTKKPNSSKRPLTHNGPVLVSEPKYAEIYFNPGDYLDMDYSFGRMKRVDNAPALVFPDTTDEDHPYHSIAGRNLKDHIRAVRNVLWKQHQFSFIPQESEYKTQTEEPVTEDNAAESTTLQYYRSKLDNDYYNEAEQEGEDKKIEIDYYFGRIQNDDVKKVGYIQQNGKLKDVFLKTDEIPSDDVLKDLKVIKFNGKRYVDDDVKSVTPHAFLLKDLSEEEFHKKATRRYSIYPHKRHKHGKVGQVDTISKIAHISDMRDVFLNIESMLKMKMPLTRRNNDGTNVLVNVLNDMVQMDDSALKGYDWLGSTVDVRAALTKLTDLSEALQDSAFLDPADVELLNYTIFLHKSAKELKHRQDLVKMNNELKKQSVLSRNKKKKGLHRAWLLRKKRFSEINQFKQLLDYLQYYLYDLHEAIKNIALVTKYKNQNWYESLKRIYFTPEKKTMLEVILHLTTTRFLGLIENSARNGLEDDFIGYILNHEKEVDRTLQELIFVLELLDELKKLEN